MCPGDTTEFILRALLATVKNYLKNFHITMRKNEIIVIFHFSKLYLLVDRSLNYLSINRIAVDFSCPLRYSTIHNFGLRASGNRFFRLISFSIFSSLENRQNYERQLNQSQHIFFRDFGWCVEYGNVNKRGGNDCYVLRRIYTLYSINRSYKDDMR